MKSFKKTLGLGMLCSVSAFAATGTKVSGFADAGFSYMSNGGKFFAVRDGAVYVSHSVGAGEVMVDIPFGTATNTGSGIALTGDKAQAFAAWKYDNGFSWKLGQFDGLFGQEAIDTVDAKLVTGSTTTALVPTVHRGTIISYGFSDEMKLHFILANPQNIAAMTAVPAGFDYGAQFQAKFAGFDTYVGYMSLLGHRGQPGVGRTGPASGSQADGAGTLFNVESKGAKPGSVINVMTDTEFAGMSFGLDISISKPARTTGGDYVQQTGSGVAIKPDQATGVSLNIGMPWDSTVDLNARVDYGTGVVKTFGSPVLTYDKNDKTIGVVVGPTFKMTDDFFVRADVAFYKDTYTDRTGTAIASVKGTKSIWIAGLSAVHKF